MRIAIDAHSVGARLGGNETYAANLIEALAAVDQTNHYTLYVTKQTAVDRFANRWPNVSVRMTLPHTPLVRIPLTLSHELRRRPVDVLHVQYTAPPFARIPIVATIHDLAFEHLPETFNRRSWMQMRLTIRNTARRAAQIITLSDYSRQDIIKTYGISPDRVTVTPAAAAERFAPVVAPDELRMVRTQYGIERDYFLSLCSLQPRKNLGKLIEAYSFLRELRPSQQLPQLVLAGPRGWLDHEISRAADQSPLRNDIKFTGYVQEADLPALYSGSICFIYPSYFEGFGLPLLEAMQCGAPVLAGNRTSLPEVVGDAGVLFDPFDARAIAETLARINDDCKYREQLIAKGRQRAQTFQWATTARKTLQVYEKATHKI